MVKGFDPHENRNLLWLLYRYVGGLGVGAGRRDPPS